MSAPAAGLDLMKQAIAMGPRDYMHHAAFAQMLMLVGQHREAEAAYRAALKLWPDEPELRSGLSSAIARQGRNEA